MTFVISLTRRADRRNLVAKRLQKLNINFRFIDGFDGKNFTEYNGKLSKGASGCLISHVSAVLAAKCAGLSQVWILEDDVVFHNDFHSLNKKHMDKLPGDWDMYLMGCMHLESPTKVNDLIDRSNKSVGLWSYVIRQNMYDAFIHAAMSVSDPVDVYTMRLQKRFNVYSCREGIVGVNKDYSDVKQMVYDPDNFNFIARDNCNYNHFDTSI